MLKNLILLGLLSWMSFSFAKDVNHPVVHDSMAEAHAYKVGKPSPEQEATRAVAGGKIKKQTVKVPTEEGMKTETNSESDSEVRYWQYSE